MSRQFTSPFDTSGQLDPDIIANPDPSYHQLRSEDPVHWNQGLQSWDLTRYTDVLEALRDSRRSADRMSVYSDRDGVGG